jgi:hypothetical protein
MEDDMLDLTKVKFTVKDAMRYDTPGDYFLKDGLWQFEAWSGLSRPEYIQEVFGHELQEAQIIVAAGITPEMIDLIDEYRLLVESFDPNALNMGWSNLTAAVFAFKNIPKKLRDLYDQAHFQAILWGRTFIDACGLDWAEYEREIEDSRGKIPVVAP